MSNIGIYTLIIMGAAFIIGFAVAYLIRFISFSLTFFERNSLAHIIVVRRRWNKINKIKIAKIQKISEQIQHNSKNELLEFYYPYQCHSGEKRFSIMK